MLFQSNLKINIFIKPEFIAELLYCITLDCTGVPNNIYSEYSCV